MSQAPRDRDQCRSAMMRHVARVMQCRPAAQLRSDELGYVGRVKSLALVLLGGCGFQSTVAQGTPDASGSTTDAPPPPDAPMVPTDARNCFGSLVNVCLAAAPPATVAFAPTLDTSVDGNCAQIVPQAGGPSLCVIAAKTIAV